LPADCRLFFERVEIELAFVDIPLPINNGFSFSLSGSGILFLPSAPSPVAGSASITHASANATNWLNQNFMTNALPSLPWSYRERVA